ncbi:MAG: hypothetical protein WD844_00700 [Thermoleophilaceae bacterium]
MTEPSLPEKVLAIHDGLGEARIAHALGGALALAYYAEPRATIDVDVNVFTPPEEHAAVLSALSPLGVEDRGVGSEAIERDGQCRWWWGRNPIDVFFAYDAFHDAMREAVILVPFGEDRIPILSAEHLVVCKAVFDRAKDWLDIEQVLAVEEDLDRTEVEGWLTRVLTPQDHRVERFRELADRATGDE